MAYGVATHVDLVENRWSAGYQERVGRAYLADGRPEVDAVNAHYRAVVLDSAAESDDFLGGLATRFHSDYFFATKPHDDDACPFADSERVPFSEPQPGRAPQSEPATAAGR
jgi:hypothetical protein